MLNNHPHPVIDIHPWPNGFGFNGTEDWWSYVSRQNEEERLDLLMTMALLSESICQLLLDHDPTLFARFQLSPQTITRLSAIRARCLLDFINALSEQSNAGFKGGS